VFSSEDLSVEQIWVDVLLLAESELKMYKIKNVSDERVKAVFATNEARPTEKVSMP